MAESEKRREGPLDGLGVAAMPLSLVTTAAFDGALLPWSQLDAGGGSAVRVVSLLALELALQGPLLLALQLVVALAIAVRARLPGERGDGLRRGAAILGGAGAAAWIYAGLVAYPRFQGYLPFVGGALALAAWWTLVLWPLPPRPLWMRLRLAASLGLVLLVASSGYAHHAYYRGYYPTLHMALLGIVQMSTFCAVVGLIDGRPEGRRPLGLVAAVVSAIVVALPLVAPVSEDVLPYVRSFAQLGRNDGAVLLGQGPATDGDELDCEALPAPPTVAQAEAIFEAHAGLEALDGPDLLEGRNVLVILIDALRLDQTSLANPELGTTPHLRALEERGAFVFTQARAPSTSTLQSTSSMLAMRLPLDTPVTFGPNNWTGRMPDAVRTVAEAARDDGLATFHVMHGGLHRCCRETLSQGFERRRFEGMKVMTRGQEGVDHELHVDEWVSDRAIEELDELAARRFFGLLFYFSPHTRYWARKPGEWDEVDRYRQEISHADAQVGRVIEALDRLALMEKTIVVITSDHGEGFRDHKGGTDHGNSVYTELKRVPLVVWVPGKGGSRQDRLTSTAYVLPWLMRQGPKHLRRAALDGIRESIAPAMLATEGGVPVNLLYGGGAPGRVAIDYPGSSIHHEFRSGLTELYDLRTDPTEQDNLWERGHPERERLLARLGAYLTHAACRARSSKNR